MGQLFPLLYFGPAAYYRLMAEDDATQWATRERYSKQTLRNRCSIYGANGKITLSIPVKRIHGKDTEMRDALLSFDEPWQQIHWRSIKSAYGRTPYFEFYEDKFEALYNKKQKHLLDFLVECNAIVFNVFKLPQPLLYLDSPGVEQQKQLDTIADLSHYPEEKHYYQIFEDRHGFIPQLSVLDWIFHCGNKL